MPGFFDFNNLGVGNLRFESLRVDRRNEGVTLAPDEQRWCAEAVQAF